MSDIIRFGTIGTNWIVDRFIATGQNDSRFSVRAAYSREQKTGASFAQKHNIPLVYTSLTEMVQSGYIDAVYVASPTALHYEHAALCLQNGMAVLCEKPFTATAAQAQSLYALAQEHRRPLLHAMRSLFEPRMQKISTLLPELGTIRQVTASRCRYSSRYDDFRAGNTPNAFNPALGNGAAMDIGIYLLQPTIALLGAPLTVHSSAVQLRGCIDGAGMLLLSYSQAQASLSFSKISTSYTPAEIQGEEGSLSWMPNPPDGDTTLSFFPRKGAPQTISVPQAFPSMYYEISVFLDMVQQKQVSSTISRPADVITSLKILEQYHNHISSALLP